MPTIINELITDRTNANAQRLEYLAKKRWVDMTADEQSEWYHGSGSFLYWADGEPVTCSDGVITFFNDGTTNKGAYNHADWNRVESAVEYLASVLRELPKELEEYCKENDVSWDSFFNVPYDPRNYALDTKTDWGYADIWRPADAKRYLSNVVKLRKAFNYATDPLPSSMDNLTTHTANAIEKALIGLDAAISAFREEMEDYIDNAALSNFYSGEVYSGEI